MTTADVLSVMAIAISGGALIGAIVIGSRQIQIARGASHIALLANQMAVFRDVQFHDDHDYLLKQLRDHDANLGIQGLPSRARSAFHNVVYFYQILAVLVVADGLNRDKILTIYQRRVILLWDAIKPFVEAERRRDGDHNRDLLANLEEFVRAAKDIQGNALRVQIERTWRRRH